MRRNLSQLAAGLLFPATIVQAQVSSLARQVFSSDSMTVHFTAISPDERWLVFGQYISNQESRLMIRPLVGGEPRQLAIAKGNHDRPRFTPAGDRILFVSTFPRRGPTDDQSYLVSAPFDTRTGTLSGPPRQVSLDGVRAGPRTIPAISPDGQWVVYLECCTSNVLKIVPATGGSARTLVEPSSIPTSLSWSPDGKFISYELPELQGFVRMRISREGGSPVAVVHSSERLGPLSADNRYSFVIARSGGGTKTTLRLFAADGKLLGEVPAPRFNPAFAGFAVNSKYILATSDNAVAPIKIVPVAGGPIRQITSGATYDWPAGWSEDGEQVHVSTEDREHPAVAIVSRSGELKSKVRLPDDTHVSNYVGMKDGYVVYKAGTPFRSTGWRIVAIDLKDGSRRELAHDVVGLCCEAAPPGGMYYGMTGNEFLFRQLSGSRLQIRAMKVSGESRLLGDVSASLIGKTPFAVYQNRLVYREPVGDSVRLQLVIGPGRAPKTLDTFGKAASPGEFAWSHDGRQLSVSAGNPQTLLVYRFDGTGVLQGSPQRMKLPFEYWYETFWLPDGSGLTMIAQPRGKGTTDVALVKLADPEHPILLTGDDPVSKWGHSLSPDGKYVAYPSHQPRGSSIYLIEVAELLKQAKAKP